MCAMTLSVLLIHLKIQRLEIVFSSIRNLYFTIRVAFELPLHKVGASLAIY